jgi:phage shock protein PspC (stress-responsive transcriptional regulator)
MDKTLKINLAGVLFQIDEDAYYILRDYLQALNRRFNNVPGGNETIEDIESRIAEIFQSQQSSAGVTSKSNVEAMIQIIGNPDDFGPPESHSEPKLTGTIRRRLYRDPHDTIIGGVCGGIGAYLNMDPVWIRIAFILFTCFFGIGFFVYVALWIALPKANSDTQKRELYGDYYYNRSDGSPHLRKDGTTARVGGAFNEVFRAIGKFFFIVFRIFMILLGVMFVVTGFVSILAFIMVFFFRYPGFISMGSFDSNLFFLPDFLNCVVNPAITPWILWLSFVAVAFPLIALVYWGIKMIFWFRAKDGIISLVFLILWVLSIATLSIILFNEGVSFSQTGRASSQEILQTKRDTLYIVADKKVKDLPVRKEFSLPDNHYSLFLSEPNDLLSIRSRLRLVVSNDKLIKIEIKKRASGHTRIDAVEKASSLIYNYRISHDTLFIDEFFTIPAGRKWAADELSVNLYLPEKTILHFDRACENMFTDRISISKEEDNIVTDTHVDFDTEPWQLGNKYWIISEDGLSEAVMTRAKQK